MTIQTPVSLYFISSVGLRKFYFPFGICEMKEESTVGAVLNRTGKCFQNYKVVLQKFLY